MFPPGKQDGMLTARVYKNLLESHVQIYHALKSMDNGSESMIGIVKNINQFDPWRRSNILDWLFCMALNHVFNSAPINFFKTGNLKFRVPGLMWLSLIHI